MAGPDNPEKDPNRCRFLLRAQYPRGPPGAPAHAAALARLRSMVSGVPGVEDCLRRCGWDASQSNPGPARPSPEAMQPGDP